MIRRRTGLVAAALVVVASASAATTVRTAGEVRQADRERRAAGVAAATTDTELDDLAAALDRLRDAVVDAEARTVRDRAAASAITDAAAQLDRMWARMDELEVAIARKSADGDARQDRIDLITGCKATLDAAATALQADAPLGDPPLRQDVTAARRLEAGRAGCQQALTLVRSQPGAVHPYDFADPSVVQVGTGYVAYSTTGPAGTIQVLFSADQRSWKVLDPALLAVPAWAASGFTWAPSVHRVADRWVLYYTVRVANSTRQCITSATSISPVGPFVDTSIGPILCQKELGGSIDPSPYRDELGGMHLTWKSEGETVKGRAQIWTQPLSASGRTLAGQPSLLLTAEEEWERKVIENPSMAKIGDRWVLLYSGNRWNTADYAMGYALCEGASGPCRRPDDEVVVRTGNGNEGPGGGEFYRTSDGAVRVAFAAWDRGEVGHPNARRLHLATATLGPDGLRLG